MSKRSLDEIELTVLYHALGANLEAGLRPFEEVFAEAEAEYRVEDLDALVGLLADPTLHDARLPAWRRYYATRKALLTWRVPEALDLLGGEFRMTEAQARRLDPRLALLRAQAHIMLGNWIEGQKELRRASNALLADDRPVLGAEIEEWTARAAIGRAQSAGDWDTPPAGGAVALWRHALAVLLFPFYLLVLAFLTLTHAQAAWPAAVRYGTNYANWPIFAHYLAALRALERAGAGAPADGAPASEARTFRLALMRADLLKRLQATKDATAAYEALEAALPNHKADYRAALVAHGLGQLQIAGGKPDEGRANLQRAFGIYNELGDERSAAAVMMLQGDLRARDGAVAEALAAWDPALALFHGKGDRLSEAEGLNRCYAFLEDPAFVRRASPQERAALEELLCRWPTQAYTVRMPTPLFRLLRLAGWIVPLAVLVIAAVTITDFLARASREGMVGMAMDLLSVRAALTVLGILVAVVLANALLGLLGLISTRWVDWTRLDVIGVDEAGLHKSGPGSGVSVAWGQVDTHLRVERSLGWQAGRSLSFDYVAARDKGGIVLPASTARFPLLRAAVEQHSALRPATLRLNWYGGLPILAFPFSLALAGYLTEARVPWLTATAHAWAAAGVMAVTYVALSSFGVYAIRHYLRVDSAVSPPRTVHAVAGVLGTAMLGAGVLAKDQVFVFAPFFIVGGAVLLAEFVHNLRVGGEAVWPRVWTGASYLVLVAAAVAVLWTTLPILINYRAFTYAGAADHADPSCASAAGARDRHACFAAMGEAGRQMVLIDPTYFAGYGYIAYERYDAGTYGESVQQFDLAMKYNQFRSNADYLYCKALAQAKDGKLAAADQPCAEFRALAAADDAPVCARLFPEDAGYCRAP